MLVGDHGVDGMIVAMVLAGDHGVHGMMVKQWC